VGFVLSMRFAIFVTLCGTLLPAQALRSLKGVPVPEPANLSDYVQDKKALIALGKAFFWDVQAGSDGATACASCHFHAGADHRPQNMLSDAGKPFPVNAALSSLSFPFRLLSDVLNRNSPVLRDTSMRVGSAGTVRRIFEGIVLGEAAELGRDAMDKAEFLLGELQARRVTSRNSPSVLNTAYYVRGFWDGRAARTFNGLTVSGVGAESPGLLVAVDGVLRRQAVQLDLASLASQGVGPALDHLEMSYEGRTWPLLGKKLLSLRPLGLQRVAVNDSVLGELARAEERGLVDSASYLALIRQAFAARYWESGQLLDSAGEILPGRVGAPEGLGEFTQVEHNFAFFWGVALMAYQATLNSDDAPFDRFMDGDRGALNAREQEGLRIFQQNGNCNECHNGGELSAAAFNINRTTRNHSFERTGVRPAAEDAGAGNGAFKSIGLRNIELTGPYFHNGGQATLEQVVDFYRRGGDFSPVTNAMRPFNISDTQRDSLVAFLKSLTDERVKFERAPFDHPELCVPVGHVEEADGRFATTAAEKWRLVPAVGADGNAAPLRTFEELLRGVGADGERAHALTQECRPEATYSVQRPAGKQK
jgi:cytochrome c peroxidase